LNYWYKPIIKKYIPPEINAKAVIIPKTNAQMLPRKAGLPGTSRLMAIMIPDRPKKQKISVIPIMTITLSILFIPNNEANINKNIKMNEPIMMGKIIEKEFSVDNPKYSA